MLDCSDLSMFIHDTVHVLFPTNSSKKYDVEKGRSKQKATSRAHTQLGVHPFDPPPLPPGGPPSLPQANGSLQRSILNGDFHGGSMSTIQSRAGSDAFIHDDGTYSRLNHNMRHPHPRNSSTSSTNSTVPLLPNSSRSNSIEDSNSVFETIQESAGHDTTEHHHGAPAAAMGPRIQSEYLQLRPDTLNPTSHYETVQ